MMAALADFASWTCLLGGSFFLLTGGIGMLRLPDIYTRSHAAGIADTLAAGLILLGLVFQAGFTLISVKLALIMIFLFFTSPTATHALIHSAHANGVKPILADEDGDHGESGP